MTRTVILVLFWLLGAGAAPAGDHCRDVEYLSASYIVCAFNPVKDTIRIYGTPDGSKDGASYWSVRDILRENREFMIFGMNAGMYHPDYAPVGLLVENGIVRRPLNLDDGHGNFFLKPNGVFYVGRGTAGVMGAEAYARARPEVAYATQSGPMLVIDGRIHPRFLPQSDSLNIRNGVGMMPDGRVAFAISRAPVRFHDFATFFRDSLRCHDALYLDGSISSLYAPEIQRNDRFARMGPMVAVVGGLPY
ncbi:phosphodiester glycosidase family protein [Rhizobium sp. ARZ01]|uniref:phosphodiester glycosidase family protein n=1 Tax=Rhizobium sp. ARZ01 TaxID=2769313 RepID=UPI0017820129|nr:phosphodiester glycosidase family protein [Rhizobium sp. ARZ01]MBD9372659.1 phosphodiester glycosidase family protein [Rhizobium sp. ARZ01]